MNVLYLNQFTSLGRCPLRLKAKYEYRITSVHPYATSMLEYAGLCATCGNMSTTPHTMYSRLYTCMKVVKMGDLTTPVAACTISNVANVCVHFVNPPTSRYVS